MSGAVQFGKGTQLFWSSMRTQGVSLTQAVATRALRQQTTIERKINPLKGRRLYSSVAEGKELNSSNRYERYINSNNADKIKLLIYNGLTMLRSHLPIRNSVSLRELEKAWEEIRLEGLEMPVFDSNHLEVNLFLLISMLEPFYPRVQNNMIVKDLDEAILLAEMAFKPLSSLTTPYAQLSTEDSEQGLAFLLEHVQANAFILEDGSGNGQHLTGLVERLRQKDIPIQAMGTDLSFYDTNMGQILSKTLGLDHVCQFWSANALFRASPRAISGRHCQHVTLAYRLIPVFKEKKIDLYLKKISAEMVPGDLWCGSIALPEGKFYNRNKNDEKAIREFSIRSCPTEFGGTTFVHRPKFGEPTDAQLVQYFNSKYGPFGLNCKEEDLSDVILNTVMTKNRFEALARVNGLKFATDAIEVECPDNKRLFVALEKN